MLSAPEAGDFAELILLYFRLAVVPPLRLYNLTY
jgi:hypothetical protein